MAATSATGQSTGSRRSPTGNGRALLVGATAFLVPPVAWILSLALTYAVQDFGCTAAASADAPDPGPTVFVVMMVINAVLLVLIVLAGWAGFALGRLSRQAPRAGLLRFLGYGSTVSALLFGFGLVLVAVNPLYLEVCG